MKDIFGVDKVQVALNRIRHFEANAVRIHPDGYWVAFSGGKDSMVVLDLVRRAGVKHTAHFSLTTVDPPELLDFVRKHYPDVERIRPPLGMFGLIVKNLMPPTRQLRYCCKELKERGGSGQVVITGIRWAESGKRKKRRLMESCLKNKNTTYLHPIIDWKDDEVWQYIKDRQLPYCSLYDEGFKRIGCVGCPMNTRRKEHFKRWSKFENLYRRACVKAFEKRVGEGKHTTWQTSDEMWSWWMEENKTEVADDNQVLIFED